MADPRALVRLTSELLWALRRDGFRIAPSQSIDVARTVLLLGFGRPQQLCDAVAGLVDVRASQREAFDAAFFRFFDPESRLGLWARLERFGASESERRAIEEFLTELHADQPDATLAALLEGRGELTRLLGTRDLATLLASADAPLRAGFVTHRLKERLLAGRTYGDLDALHTYLVGAFGEERASQLTSALRAELTRSLAEARALVRDRAQARERERAVRPSSALETPFDQLSAAEIGEVRAAVRRLVERLRGREAVRRRRAARGKIASGATIRRSFQTFGVPIHPALRARRPRRPKLVVLCDISESVRTVARLLLELAYLAQSLFADTRSFVFVSELGETTGLFAQHSISAALAMAYGGRVVSVASNSNYGRVFRAFVETELEHIDRRTTVLVLGDGRTNYLDPGAEALARIAGRARALYWFCPELRASWSQGDSAMELYARHCTKVLEVRSARDLEQAVRAVLG